eukprot:357528-Chlamydomonas_euryale.AAC.6
MRKWRKCSRSAVCPASAAATTADADANAVAHKRRSAAGGRAVTCVSCRCRAACARRRSCHRVPSLSGDMSRPLRPSHCDLSIGQRFRRRRPGAQEPPPATTTQGWIGATRKRIACAPPPHRAQRRSAMATLNRSRGDRRRRGEAEREGRACGFGNPTWLAVPFLEWSTAAAGH